MTALKVCAPKYWPSPEVLKKVLTGVDEICEASDVYQLCAVYWYIVNGEHPTGNVSQDDWANGPEKLFQLLTKSLSQQKSLRPENGKALFQLFNEIV